MENSKMVSTQDNLRIEQYLLNSVANSAKVPIDQISITAYTWIESRIMFKYCIRWEENGRITDHSSVISII